MPQCSRLEKLSGEQASVTKAKVQSLVPLIFKYQIEFVGNVATRAGMGGNSNSSTIAVEIVIRSG